jgi:hypothetical protein
LVAIADLRKGLYFPARKPDDQGKKRRPEMAQRTQKNWLGQEKLSAKMTGVTPEQVAGAVEAAQESWDSDRLAHVYKASALTDLEADGLTEVLDGILRIGWVLHSASMGGRTVGPNAQQAMFVFTRPAARP